MNKLFTRIGVAFVGIAMAIGVGVAVGNKKTARASADDPSAAFVFGDIASANSWTDGSAHTSIEISPITLSATGGGNNGKYYTSDKTWRMYNGGTVNAVAEAGNTIVSITSNPSKTFTIDGGSASLSCSETTKFKSITVTYRASSDYISELRVSPSTAITIEEDNVIDAGSFTVEGKKNGESFVALTANTDYLFQGCGTGTGDNFVSSSTTIYKYGATRLQWKAKFPTTAGGSTYAYFGISLTVTREQVKYVKVTNDNDLQAGKKYLLVEEATNANSKFYALGAVESNVGVCEEVILDTENHLIANRANKGNAVDYTLGGESGAWTLYGNGVYLSHTGGNNNNLYTSDTATTNNQKWTIATSTGDITNVAASTRKMRFNYNSGSPRIVCYTSGQTALFLYEKVPTVPALSMDETLTSYVGETGRSLTVTPSNYEPDTFVWSSSDDTVVAVSGSTATAALTLKKVGTATISVTASKDATSVTKNCIVTVKPAPTAVQVVVAGNPVAADYVMEQYEGKTKNPTIAVVPAEASQEFTSTVQSETVDGAFEVSGSRIYYNKPATGVIRFTSIISSVYFDLNVKCNADPYTEDSLTVTGDPVAQNFGDTFNTSGLTFKITKASGQVTVNVNELTFEPERIQLDTTTVTATHTASGQTVDIDITVDTPLTVAQALTIINGLADNGKTDRKYTVFGIASYAQNIGTYTTQDYRLSDDGTDSNTLTVFRGTWINGAPMSGEDGHFVGEGDKIYAVGQLQKYVKNETTTPEMIGNAPIADITIYYTQIKNWIDTYLHLEDYTSELGYCKDAEHHYYTTAKAALKTLEDSCDGAISEFQSNHEEDFKAAYSRYVAWAEANGDAAPFDGNAGIQSVRSLSTQQVGFNNSFITIVIVISSLTFVAIGAYFVFKRKER